MFGETISELPGYFKRNAALRIYQMLILNLPSNGEENLKEVTIPKHHLNFASPSGLSLLVPKLLSIMLLISLLVVAFVSLNCGCRGGTLFSWNCNPPSKTSSG